MEDIRQRRQDLKSRLRNRERVFAGWVSYSHPSITETFARAGFDFIAIDMEHSTITVEQAQRIMAACHGEGTLCLPRPVSHSNDWIKPLLDSGADGLVIPMVNTSGEAEKLLGHIKYPPLGRRSFGLNRAQGYGFNFNDYVESWNETSSVIIQIESVDAIENIEQLLAFEHVDGAMIGPYDISGSLGIPGQIHHLDVKQASGRVIEACEKFGKACGTQDNDPSRESVEAAFDAGFTFVVLSSDLFILWKWSEQAGEMIRTLR